MPEIRVIKKYPNRRLYDTELGIYITLADIKKMVGKNMEFQVIDARTKKDITQSTLLQIITELEATATPLFTTAVLQEFIRFYHEKSENAFSQYLEQAMRVFNQQKDFFQNQMSSYQKLLRDPTFTKQLKVSPKKTAKTSVKRLKKQTKTKK